MTDWQDVTTIFVGASVRAVCCCTFFSFKFAAKLSAGECSTRRIYFQYLQPNCKWQQLTGFSASVGDLTTLIRILQLRANVNGRLLMGRRKFGRFDPQGPFKNYSIKWTQREKQNEIANKTELVLKGNVFGFQLRNRTCHLMIL